MFQLFPKHHLGLLLSAEIIQNARLIQLVSTDNVSIHVQLLIHVLQMLSVEFKIMNPFVGVLMGIQETQGFHVPSVSVIIICSILQTNK